jgi:tetratricopeptide (TPR) repeat protein
MGKLELIKKLDDLIVKLNENPNDFFINIEVAEIYYDIKEYEDALLFYKNALALRPAEIGLNLSIGLAYGRLKKFDAAQSCYEQILAYNDNSERFSRIKAGAYLNLANIYYDSNDFDKSIELLEKAINISPKYSNLYMNLGNCYRAKNDLATTVDCFKKAIELDKNNVDAWYNLGEIQILQGDFKNGFANYEYRFLRSNINIAEYPKFKKPRWHGEDLKSKTIFVCGEQGFGDAIQFSRFFYDLKQRGAKVLYNSRESLSELFKSNELICPEIIPLNSHKEPSFEANFNYHIPLMSLPHVLGITKETIPFSAPYVFADPQKTEKFKEILKNDKNKLKIGIKWRGNTNIAGQRVISLKEFSVFNDMQNVSFYSFQKDGGFEELVKAPLKLNNDLVSHFKDFSETAGALANMDLLITNDSSMAHLGGAMGIKTFIILPYISEWRWGLDSNTSPWYDSVKLFRQKTAGDWTGVFAEVKTNLIQLNFLP